MPENYELALFLHLVGVAGSFGAAAVNILTLAWMRRSETVQGVRQLSPLAVWSDRAFPVAALVILAAGAWMVEEYDLGWGTGWINTSLLALVVMGAGGGLLLTPRIGAIHKAAATAPDGAVPAELRERMTDPVLWGTLHAFTLGMIGIIWNMTTKPSDAQSGAVILLTFVIGGLSVLPMAARARSEDAGR